MADFQIVKLAAEAWRQYKQIRLESLLREPQAFGSRYEDQILKPDSYWQGRLAEAQSGEKSWLLFAREGDRLIGMIGAYRAEEAGVVEIISVYVNREKRGLGVGSLLMSAILDEVIKPGVFQKAVLGVNKEQTTAVALYRRFGFQVVGEKTGVEGDGLAHTGYVMEKLLAARPLIDPP